MSIELELTNCGFCGSEKYEILFSAPKHSTYSKCQIVQCCNCSLARTNPRPSQVLLNKLYTENYYSREIPKVDNLASQLKILAMKFSLSFLYPRVIPFKIPTNASICDVGCGAGHWLSLMKTAYPTIKLSGFEIDAQTAEIASNLCGGDIRYGDFLNNQWPSNSFDFITFWDVLEHIDNLSDFVKEIKRLLKPNGIVVILSPNFECIYSKIFKGCWWALLFDQHLYHFSKKTLSMILHSIDLKPIYFKNPMIPVLAHWNIVNLLKEMKHENSNHKVQYFAWNLLKEIARPADKLYISRLMPQHLLMCGQKISH